MNVIDKDYDEPKLVGQVRRYWHTGRHCWVVAWVGEIVCGQDVQPAPDALIDLAAGEFKPLNSGRRSSLEGRVERALKDHGPCDTARIAAILGVESVRIRHYVRDHADTVEKVGFNGRGHMVYRLVEKGNDNE